MVGRINRLSTSQLRAVSIVTAIILPFPKAKREPEPDPVDLLALQIAYLELTQPGTIIYESSMGWTDTAPSEMNPDKEPA